MTPALRRDLRTLLDRAPELPADDPFLADCVARLTATPCARRCRRSAWQADLIGFHGQTILHRPSGRGRTRQPFTWQVGDAQRAGAGDGDVRRL